MTAALCLLILGELAHLVLTAWLWIRLTRYTRSVSAALDTQVKVNHTSQDAIGELQFKVHRLNDLTRYLVH